VEEQHQINQQPAKAKPIVGGFLQGEFSMEYGVFGAFLTLGIYFCVGVLGHFSFRFRDDRETAKEEKTKRGK